MHIFVLLLLLVASSNSLDVALRSVEVKGNLICGTEPYQNAHVRLYRVKSEADHEILDRTMCNAEGKFKLEGNTQGRAVNETTMTPIVRIYHKCGDDPAKDRGFRQFHLQIPSDFVKKGHVPALPYDIGTLNLQITYPGEISGVKVGSLK